MLSDEWWVRDARTDSRKDSRVRSELTDNCKLISWKIVSDEHHQELIIPKLTCFDMSGHCDRWKEEGECKNNPRFMESDCAKTCGFCTSEADEKRAKDKKTVDVKFVNQHDHSVELYCIHGGVAEMKATLKPRASMVLTTMLSDEWWVRDARTDSRKDSMGGVELTENSKLISWKIVSDEHHQELIIPKLTCFDLSGHCHHWKEHGECKNNRRFMESDCAKTCGVCNSEADEKEAEDKKTKQEAGSDEL
jgi:hypothetical protein